jgi:carboxyl-terminal processing protease
MFLTQADINRLSKNKNGLFKSIESGSEEYVTNASQTYQKALTSFDSILSILSKKTFNFNDNDTIYFLPISTKTFYSPDLKYHAKRIERFVKSRSYDRVCNNDDYQKLTEKEFNARAQEFSKTVIENLNKTVKDQSQNIYGAIETNLLNAIALRHDPHSNYLNENQSQEFSKQLSSKVESFGLYFDNDDDGNIIISYIEPGGAAWQSNEINEGDIFVSVKMGVVLIPAEGNSVEDIQDKLDKTAENKISLTIKKPNGSFKTVKLIKQKVASTENSVKGYVLKNNGEKVGYISLPSFYTSDFEEKDALGCANDVAKEIVKLQSDSINGLIIDLRNNGGGSMGEAMNLAGIFVDEGPLFILKEKNRKPYSAKDMNRGSLFKKPLVLLINETSASASELLSNIVKDYNLGLVVGQVSYGKGTAQSVMPLDTNVLKSKTASVMNKDYIKITNSKFYRLNCSTHQGKGVMPDVILPSSPGYSIYKESFEKFYLESDTVSKKVVYTPNPPINVIKIKSNSAERINTLPEFKRYIQSADSLSKSLNTTQKVAIKFNDYKKYKSATTTMFTSFENASELKNTKLECHNNTFDQKLTQVNEQTKEFNDRILQSIREDIFINETFNIITDLINQQKNK